VVNAKTPGEAVEIARKKLSLKDVAKDITCPFLVSHGGTTTSGRSGTRPSSTRRSARRSKTSKMFSTEEGGAEHAHVDNRQVGITLPPTG